MINGLSHFQVVSQPAFLHCIPGRLPPHSQVQTDNIAKSRTRRTWPERVLGASTVDGFLSVSCKWPTSASHALHRRQRRCQLSSEWTLSHMDIINMLESGLSFLCEPIAQCIGSNNVENIQMYVQSPQDVLKFLTSKIFLTTSWLD